MDTDPQVINIGLCVIAHEQGGSLGIVNRHFYEDTVMDTSNPAINPNALLERAVEGAHATVDRLAEAVTPAVEQLTQAVDSAGDALNAKAVDARALQEEWTAALRDAVRDHPIAAVLTAAAVGVLVGKLVSR